MDIRRALIVLGLLLLGVGAFWPFVSRLPFGRLPEGMQLCESPASMEFD